MFIKSKILCRLWLSAGLAVLPVTAATAGSTVEIIRDDWGVPHVYSEDVYGLYAGFGYAVAEDRLFQMEMSKRSVLGTVSEVLGIEYLPFDLRFRSDFDHDDIRAQIETLPADQRNILKGYAAGYNKRLAEVMAAVETLLPKQFSEFGFKPSTWTEFDVAMLYVGTMAGRFSHYSAELDNAKILAALEKKHGPEKAKILFDQMYWIEDPLAPTTVRAGGQYQRKAEMEWPESGRFAALVDMVVPGGDDTRPRASNAWLLGPKKTTDGSTILINGPQFGNFNPAYVFSIGLHGAGFDLTGNTPFAVPNVLFGTNGTIAWGATAGPLDVNDYYQLDLNPKNPQQYRRKGAWVDMKPKVERFNVKGRPEVTTTVYRSDYGVVSAIDPQSNTAFGFKRSWAGYEIQTLMAWVNSTKAQNYEEWLDQASKVATTINWYYADKNGNIGYVSPGYLPRRADAQDPRLPAKTDGSMEWQGIRSFDEVPKTYNPEIGYIANWNNRSAKGSLATVEGSPWGGADRVVEIMSRLESRDKLTPGQAWDINREISFLDINARYFVPFILKAAASLPADDKRQKMVEILRQWDGQQIRDKTGLANSPAVAIFRAWMDIMVASVLLDDNPAIPPKILQNRISQASQILHNALLGSKSGVPQTFDFLNGADEAGRDRIVLEALAKTGEALTAQFGSDSSDTWRIPLTGHVFETENYLKIPQASPSEKREIGTAMNRGTENNMIVFEGGKASFCAVTPPGQSGFISPSGQASPHYEDQLALYENFECRPQALLRADVDAKATNTLRFTVE
jgi:penicillin amidase